MVALKDSITYEKCAPNGGYALKENSSNHQCFQQIMFTIISKCLTLQGAFINPRDVAAQEGKVWEAYLTFHFRAVFVEKIVKT